MKRVRIAELRAKLSHYVRAAERGHRFEILDRNRPIAQLGPLEPDFDDLGLRPPLIRFQLVRDKRVEAAAWAGAAESLLIADRRKR